MYHFDKNELNFLFFSDFDNNGSIDEKDLMKTVDGSTQDLNRARVLQIENNKHISGLVNRF